MVLAIRRDAKDEGVKFQSNGRKDIRRRESKSKIACDQL